MQATGLIIGGKAVPCALPVFNWRDHGLEFKPGHGSRHRKGPPDLFVWHWSAGEGTYEGCFRVLNQRELGVEFYIGGGIIYQYADPLTVDTYDAGKYNPRSCGCEIRNYGFTDWDRPLPDGYKARALYETEMNGRKRKFAVFHPGDIAAAIALGEAVSNAIPSIPKEVPSMLPNTLYPDYIGDRRMRNVHGHIGHYHISDQKSDPGHDLLQAFIDSGKFAAAPVPA